MKVLHLPFNISSQVATTVKALRQLGVDARGLVRNISAIQSNDGIESVDWTGKPGRLARFIRGIKWRSRMLRALAWADVIHWSWGDTIWKGLDLKAAAWMTKPRLVEFWGDDLRDPAIASRDNPFMARMYERNPELAETRSRQVQRMFSRNGFECLIPGYELADYLDPSAFRNHYKTKVRICVDDFSPRCPDPSNPRPLVVHAPSDKLRKGTEAVLSAVGELSTTHAFEFRLIHNLPRSEALAVVRECDLFLDQFTIGAEGLATYEAMAFGKPVVCYIKPALRDRYPAGFPIIIADQNNLQSVLAACLNDAALRHDTGRRSREYVEKYHDARKVAAELVELYQLLLAARKPQS